MRKRKRRRKKRRRRRKQQHASLGPRVFVLYTLPLSEITDYCYLLHSMFANDTEL